MTAKLFLPCFAVLAMLLLHASDVQARSLLDMKVKQPPVPTRQFNQRTLNQPLLGWREIDNIPYVPGSTDPAQTLDLLLPAHKKHQRLPVVVYIHGGGWYEGDKRLSPARVLVNFGFVVASINYRLTAEARFPAQIDDCRAAVRWLRQNAAQYNLDPDRIGVWGMSAGGHLAALLGTTSGAQPALFRHEAPDTVQAVVDWFGPTDFTKLGDVTKLSNIARKAVLGLFGGPPNEHQEEAAAASPSTYVRAGLPPFLIMHGDHDGIVPLTQSTELFERLRKDGDDATLVVVPEAGHEIFGPEYIEKVVEFFKRKL